MQTTSVSPLSNCYYPIHKHHYSHYRKSPISPPITSKSRRLLPRLCSSHANKHDTQFIEPHYPTKTIPPNNLQEDTNGLDIDEMYPLFDDNNPRKKLRTEEPPPSPLEETVTNKSKTHRGISSNMWWANMKAKLGQRFNLEGIVSVVGVMNSDRHLAIPHVSVKDIRWIDWAELHQRGFRGVVFDKDNTLTAPYSLELWPSLDSSLSSCKSVFGDNVAVFSNSAGLLQYDVDGSKARAIEESIGVHVIRHGVKKPAGGVADIENYFGCESELLVMVGDRHFTDIVYGNRNGFLTILTEPLSLVQEPFVVKQVRKLEASLANYWHGRGIKPTCHTLLPQAMDCIKIPPPL